MTTYKADVKLRPEIKRLWTAALRSDYYQQGHRYLTTIEDGRRLDCCLGVMSDLAVKAGVLAPPTPFTGCALAGCRLDQVLNYDSSTIAPPWQVEVWAFGEVVGAGAWVVEVPPGAPGYRGDGTQLTTVELAELNDSRDVTFAQIADLIEASL